MELIDLSVEQRGFAPHCIALSVRTAGTCPGMLHRPDARIMAGIALFSVQMDPYGDFQFDAHGRYLEPGETAADLLDWLDPQLATPSAIVTWDNWWPVARRLAALADPDRHAHVLAAASDTAGRWRELSRADSWYLRQGRCVPVPCVCGPVAQMAGCNAAVPLTLLPPAEVAIPQLIAEAMGGWRAWTMQFAALDRVPEAAQAWLAFNRWRATTPIWDDS